MPEFALQRRLAAEIAKVGENNIKFNVDYVDEIADALTREDIKKLIKDGKIIIEKPRGVSRARAREKQLKRKLRSEGRKHGSKKGPKGARVGKKEVWVNKIRKIRKYLRWLRDNNIIDRRTYRLLYRKAKGNTFKNLSDVKTYLSQLGYKVE
ncbi:MAG: 50S ribosomal protein L19e [Sulfolobaceae archaeon]|nr:50S ribosomal protein L19e [Sulfolobaceae archaeon]